MGAEPRAMHCGEMIVRAAASASRFTRNHRPGMPAAHRDREAVSPSSNIARDFDHARRAGVASERFRSIIHEEIGRD